MHLKGRFNGETEFSENHFSCRGGGGCWGFGRGGYHGRVKPFMNLNGGKLTWEAGTVSARSPTKKKGKKCLLRPILCRARGDP